MHPKLVLAVLMQEGRPELLAVVFGMERFHTYVYAQQDMTVETDHKPLISISKKALSSAPKRLQRLLLRLQRYTFNLVYRPGSELVLADTLSRARSPIKKSASGGATPATSQPRLYQSRPMGNPAAADAAACPYCSPSA